jgi:hypothetical protein
MERTIDTTAERAAFEASRRAERPDPLQSEIAALRTGIADLRDAVGALRADVAALRDVMAVKATEEKPA